MKTVLYTISTLQRSGPSLVLYGLIKNLDRSHFVPVVSTLADETEVTLKPEFEKLGVKIYCLHKRGASTFLSGAFEFRQLLRRIQPDIIHANGFRDILLTALVIQEMRYRSLRLGSRLPFQIWSIYWYR